MKARDREMDKGRSQEVLSAMGRMAEWDCEDDDPKRVLTFYLTEIHRLFSSDCAYVSLVDPSDNMLYLEASVGVGEVETGGLSVPLGVGIPGWVALHQKSTLVTDVRTDARYVALLSGMASVVAVPLTNKGGVIGVLVLEKQGVDGFASRDVEDLERIAGMVSVQLIRLWRMHSLEKRVARFESVVRIGRRLSNRFELEGILEDLTREGIEILGCRMGALYLLSRGQAKLQLQVLVDRNGAITHSEELALEDSSLGTTVTHCKTVEVGNLAKTEEHHLVRFIQEYELVGMLSCPVVYEHEVIGVLNAYTDKAHRFSDDEKQIFRALADLGAVAIENARLYSRIMEAEDSLRSGERLTLLGMLAAEIAHEIRNPLTVIQLLVESMMLEPGLDPRRMDDLDVVLDKINHLGEIVGRVLNFGKNQRQIFARWDLGQIIRDSAQLVRFKLMKARIILAIDCPSGPVMINGNRGQIQQVLLNLILNAEEAMPAGGRISIQVSRENRGGQSCHAVTIRDTGSGVPETIRDVIFESFLTDKPEGSGLGLAIVKRILKDHRGDIELRESSAQGSAFHFWLPDG